MANDGGSVRRHLSSVYTLRVIPAGMDNDGGSVRRHLSSVYTLRVIPAWHGQ